MAVDSSVRMLVASGQPDIVAACIPPRGTLLKTAVGQLPPVVLDRSDVALDAVRYAFRACSPTAIVNLVVVVFALDGAKAGPATAEAAWCGPRPVRLLGFPSLQRPIDPRLSGTAELERLLQRHTLNLDMTLVPFAEAHDWPMLQDLRVQGHDPRGTVGRFLKRVASQLTALVIDPPAAGLPVRSQTPQGVEPAGEAIADPMLWYAALESAGRLESLVTHMCDLSYDRVAQALVRSGAPLRDVRLFGGSDELCVRLANEIPTLTRLVFPQATAPVRARLTAEARARGICDPQRRYTVDDALQDASSAALADIAFVDLGTVPSDGDGGRHSLFNIAEAFPVATTVYICCSEYQAPELCIATALPATTTRLVVEGTADPSEFLHCALPSLAAGGGGLTHLEVCEVPRVNCAVLCACSETLRVLTIALDSEISDSDDDDESVGDEENGTPGIRQTLAAHLPNLTTLSVDGIALDCVTSASCAPTLRSVSCIGKRQQKMSLAELTKICKQLTSVHTEARVIEVPLGWQLHIEQRNSYDSYPDTTTATLTAFK